MRSLDTNILARLLVDDPDDAQAAAQRPAAIAALSTRAFVTVTVLLELEWVLRGFYGLQQLRFAGLQIAKLNVLPNRALKQKIILQHNSQIGAIAVKGDF